MILLYSKKAISNRNKTIIEKYIYFKLENELIFLSNK